MTASAAANADAFVEALAGWQRDLVMTLRAAIIAGAKFDEIIKWQNLVFVANGPCILIHVEEARVVLGFWRGKRLTSFDPRIVASGKYELGNLTLTQDTLIDPALVTRLASEAAALNTRLGDPTAAAPTLDDLNRLYARGRLFIPFTA